MTTILMVLLYRMRARWHIVAIMVLLLLASMLAPDAFFQRIDDLVSGKDDTGSHRLDIWRTAFQALERSGILGVGLDNFPLLYKGFVPGRAATSHNVYLTALMDLGVPGLAMMLAAMVSGLLAVWRARSAGHSSIVLSALEAASIGTLASCMFGDILWTKMFWMAWILLTWAIYSEKRADGTSDALARHG